MPISFQGPWTIIVQHLVGQHVPRRPASAGCDPYAAGDEALIGTSRTHGGEPQFLELHRGIVVSSQTLDLWATSLETRASAIAGAPPWDRDVIPSVGPVGDFLRDSCIHCVMHESRGESPTGPTLGVTPRSHGGALAIADQHSGMRES